MDDQLIHDLLIIHSLMEEKSASCSVNNLCGVRITSSVIVDILRSILTTFNLLGLSGPTIVW